MKKIVTILALCLHISMAATAQLIDFSALKHGSVTDVDGNVYPTIRFGDMWWMATNLRTKHLKDGTDILQQTKFVDPDDPYNDWMYWERIARWGYADFDPSTFDTYGLIYSWKAGMDACPEGWRLTDTADWYNLARFVVEKDNLVFIQGERPTPTGGTEAYDELSIALELGRFMKTDNGALWTLEPTLSKSCGQAGMNVVPAGNISNNKEGFGDVAEFWTPNYVHADGSGSGRRFMSFSYDDHSMTMLSNHNARLRSVRCVKLADTTTYRSLISDPENGAVYVLNGTDTLFSGNRAETGTELAVTAVPATGYKADSISINGNWYPGSEAFVTITRDMQVGAAFSRQVYAITASAIGNGAVYIIQSNDTLRNGSNVLFGEKVRLVAEAEYGYRLESLMVNGEPVLCGELYAVPSAVSVVATFGLESYQLTIQDIENGHLEIMASGDSLHSGDMVEYGTRISVVAVPDEGFHLDSLTINGNAVSSAYTIAGASQAAAWFSRMQMPVSAIALGKGAVALLCGEDTVASGSSVPYGSALHFSVAANPGYYCSSFLVNGVAVPVDSVFCVKSAIQVSSAFALQSFPVLCSSVGNGAFTLMKGGKLVNSGDLFTYGSSLFANAVAGDGYQIDSVLVNGMQVAPQTVLSVIDTMELEAYFSPLVYALSIRAEGVGKVSILCRGDTLAENSAVWFGDTLSASARAGENAVLSSFLVNGSNAGVDTTFVVTGHVGISAVFASAYATVNIVQPEHGELFFVHGSDTLSSGDSLPIGTELAIVAASDAGYNLVSAKFNGKAVPVPGPYVLAGNVVATASFSQQIYTLTCTLHGDGGMIAVRDAGGDVASGEYVAAGAELSVFAEAKDGYRLDSLMVNGERVECGAKSVVSGDVYVQAWFSVKYYSIGVADISDYGALSVWAGEHQFAFGDSVAHGTYLSIVVQPSEGFVLDSVLVNGMQASGTITVAEDVLVSASFSLQSYMLSVDMPENGQLWAVCGNDTIRSGKMIPYGAELAFVAEASAGYRLDSITINGVSFDASERYTVSAPAEVSASFSLQQFAVDISASAHASLYAVCCGDTIVSGTALPYGSLVTVCAEPEEGYKIDRILVNGDVVSGSFSLLGDAVLSSVSRIETYPVGIAMPVNGTLSATAEGMLLSDGSELPYGAELLISVAPSLGYLLDSVSVNGSKFDTATIWTLTSPVEIGAHFSLEMFSVSFESVDNGTYLLIAGKDTLSSGASVAYGTQIKCVAEADEGCVFDSLSINGTVVDMTSGYTVTSDISASASFSLQNFLLTVAYSANGSMVISDGVAEYRSGDMVPYGTPLQFSFNPADGCMFDSFTINGKQCDAGQWYAVEGNMLFVPLFYDPLGIDPAKDEPAVVYSISNAICADVADGAEVSVYSMSGVRLAVAVSTGSLLSFSVPQSGIYIVVIRGKYLQVAKCVVAY